MNILNVSRKKTFLFLASIVYFHFSLIILSHYSQGDRKVFQDMYYLIGNLDFSNSIDYFRQYLSTDEIGWLLVNYPFSYFGFSKIYLDSILATIFFYIILSYFYKYGKIWIFILFQYFLNIQFLALTYSSQKLFLAFFFFSIFFFIKRNYIYLFLSIISHYTIIAYTFVYAILMPLKSRNITLIFSMISLLIIVGIFIGEYLFIKAKIYGLNFELIAIEKLFKTFFLFGVSILFCKNNFYNVCFSLGFFLLCVLIPNERSIQLFYFYTFYLLSISKQLIKIPFMLALTGTSMYKGYFYILGVFEIGNGLDPNNF